MEFKVKHLLFLILIIVFVIVSLIVVNNKINRHIDTIEYETEENSIGFNNYEDTEKLIMRVIVKNGDWSNLLLTGNFRSKYNEKDGILGNVKFDNVEYKPFNDGKYPFEERTYFVITQGLKKTAYTFNLIGKGGYLDDIKYFETFNITDEYGQELDAREIIKEDNFIRIFNMLSRGGNDERSVAVTEKFHKKYPYFLDIFIHYSPIGANEIIFEEGDFDKRIAYFTVDSILECIKREYEVKFELDERGYLDDVSVKILNEEPYERDELVKAYDAVFYKNSNWNCLKLTDKFRKKFKKEKGVFKDIDLIDYNIELQSIIYDNNFIKQYQYKSGSKKWFYKKFIYVEDDYLDDVEIIPISYTGSDAEEAKEVYIKSQQ